MNSTILGFLRGDYRQDTKEECPEIVKLENLLRGMSEDQKIDAFTQILPRIEIDVDITTAIVVLRMMTRTSRSKMDSQIAEFFDAYKGRIDEQLWWMVPSELQSHKENPVRYD